MGLTLEGTGFAKYWEEQGMEKGIEKGREEGLETSALGMLKLGLGVEMVVKATGLKEEIVLELQKTLEK